MAVQLDLSQLTIAKVAGAFGSDLSMAHKLDATGCNLKGSPKAIHIVFDNDVVGSANANLGAVAMSLAGGLGPATKMVMMEQFNVAMKQALDKLTKKGVAVPEKAEPVAFENLDVEDVPPPKPKPFKSAAAMHKLTPDGEPMPVNEQMGVPSTPMKKGAKVKLTEATELYQPVSSTTEGSTYFMVARSGNLKVAARVLGHQLSIRVEGQSAGHAQALAAAGLTKANGHWSMHLAVPDALVGRKALGAVLYGMAVPFEVMGTDYSQLSGS